MLSCPDCNHELKATRIETGAPGGTVEVDRCAFCGGVWFDHYEVNRLPTHEALRLSSLVTEQEMEKLVGSGVCPHCGIKLTPLSGSWVGNQASVLHCSHCRGNWISKKDLTKVKTLQDARLKKFKLLGMPLPTLSAILIPLLILAFVAGSMPLTIRFFRGQNEMRIRAKELIGTPIIIPVQDQGATRIVVISFTTSVPAQSFVELSGSPITSVRTLAVSETPKLLHTIRLTDLPPQTVYTIRIKIVDADGKESISTPFTFGTK